MNPQQDRERALAARAVLEVNLAAVAANVALTRQWCPSSKVMPIIKGDAYGAGAVQVARALEQGGADAFGVDNVGEAIALREAGIVCPILVLDGCLPENVGLALHYGLTLGIANELLLQACEQVVARQGGQIPVWLYYNCGFNRSGYRDLDAFLRFVQTARDCSAVRIEAVYSHLTDSNDFHEYTHHQIADYLGAVERARTILAHPIQTSLLATHGILAYADLVRDDWVRPGILLYGAECFTEAALTEAVRARVARLAPALSLRARLIHKQQFGSDQYIGYGRKTVARNGASIGTVAIGFGNGLPLNPAQGYFRHRGEQLALVTVGMDYSQVDLGACSDITPYDWVSLFGPGTTSLKQFAAAMGISPYVCMRQLRLSRTYSHPNEEQPCSTKP